MKAKGEGIGGIAGKGAPIGVASGGALEREWLLRSPSETLLEFRLQQPAPLPVSQVRGTWRQSISSQLKNCPPPDAPVSKQVRYIGRAFAEQTGLAT